MKICETEIEGIGKVLFRESKRAKKLRITVKSARDIEVTVPRGASIAQAMEFVSQKSHWISKSVLKMEEVKATEIFSEKSDFRTKHHRLLVEKSDSPKSIMRISNSKILVRYDCSREVADPEVQEFIVSAIESALRKEAREYLPERTAELAQKFGLKYNRVFLKRARTRWGSCSSKKNINLNIHLMRLPDRYIDYVILHELAHTVEMNHSPRFWKLLESMEPDSEKLKQEMKSFQPFL